MHQFDLVTIGECLVEFSRESDGCYRPAWAGDAVNVLFYASRLGLTTGFVSTFGDDLFTPMIREGISGEGIDLSLTDILPGGANGLYFIDLDSDGEYTFHFWRKDSAATETLLRIDEERLCAYISRSAWLLFSGITLAVMKEPMLKEPTRLTRLLNRLRESSTTRVAFDTNYRPALWNSPDEYLRAIEVILPFVDLFLPSRSDLEHLRPDQDAMIFLQSFGVEHCVMKSGARGCLILQEGNILEIPPERNVNVVDATGAGDAFNAGFIAGVMRGFSSEASARLGMQVAEGVLGVRGAIDREFVHSRYTPGQ